MNPHPWARGLCGLGWLHSLLAPKSLSLFFLESTAAMPPFCRLKSRGQGAEAWLWDL